MVKSCCSKSGSQASIVTPRTNSTNGRISYEVRILDIALAVLPLIHFFTHPTFQDEPAPCCCCCMCCGPNGCTKRAASITFGVIGFILAVGMVVPPIYIYTQVLNTDFSARGRFCFFFRRRQFVLLRFS